MSLQRMNVRTGINEDSSAMAIPWGGSWEQASDRLRNRSLRMA